MEMICKNAYEAWYCYWYGGIPTVGKEALVDGKCEACRLAEPPYEQEPSFLEVDE